MAKWLVVRGSGAFSAEYSVRQIGGPHLRATWRPVSHMDASAALNLSEASTLMENNYELMLSAIAATVDGSRIQAALELSATADYLHHGWRPVTLNITAEVHATLHVSEHTWRHTCCYGSVLQP